MTAQELWEEFKGRTGIDADTYDAWAFGSVADKLADLTMRGIKTATASAYPLYEVDGEELPKEGLYNIILDSKDNALGVVRTTKVYVVPFNEVTAEHAYKEGEGDRSLEYWRQVHREVFTQWMEEAGLKFDENMKVVCEELGLIYRPD